MSRTTTTGDEQGTGFAQHPGRGRFNAAFFRLMGPYLERSLRAR
jgi:hypothetical protein